jgi:hypothetical protein
VNSATINMGASTHSYITPQGSGKGEQSKLKLRRKEEMEIKIRAKINGREIRKNRKDR